MKEESQKIASNTISQIIGRVFVLALTLISIKLITNYLGPGGTGLYSTIVTYFSFFIVIADFGLFSVAVREISKAEDHRRIIKNIFVLRLVSAIIVTLIALVIVFLTDYDTQFKYGVLAAALFPIFNLAGSIYDMVFQAKLEMQKVALAEVISKAVAIVGLYLAILLGWGFYGIVATIPLAAIVGFVVKAILSRTEVPLGLKYDQATAGQIIRMALPLGIVFIVNNLYFKIDTLMLFYFKGAEAVGIYSVAYRVLETTLFAGSYLSSSLKPLLSTSIETDKPKAIKAVTQANIFLLFMGLLIALICLSFPREIIMFLSNRDFLPGAPALVILGLAGVFIYLSGLFGEIMIAKDLRRTMIKISLFILCFNVALNLYLIPRYSFYGAAWATLVSELVLLSLGYFVARRVIELKLDWRRLFLLLLISLLSVGLGQILKYAGLYFILNILTISLFYVLLAYGLDAIPKILVGEYLRSSLKLEENKETKK